MSDHDALLLAAEIRGFIASYVETSPDNYSPHFQDRYFDSPLVGWARADDPVFLTVREQVGPQSLTPQQALLHSLTARCLAGEPGPEDISVLSWVLPTSKLVREKNRCRRPPRPLSGGMAHRLGSVEVDVRLPETARTYTKHMEYCLSSRGCTACIRRCPAGALSREGHDKDLCYEMVQAGSEAAARRERLGLAKTGCGLGQVGVPCEDRIPVKNQVM